MPLANLIAVMAIEQRILFLPDNQGVMAAVLADIGLKLGV
jgi:hypothetical protein